MPVFLLRGAVGEGVVPTLLSQDGRSNEMALFTEFGRKTRATDHIHPTFRAGSTKIQTQTAMLSADGRSLNTYIVPVPPAWLARTYPHRIVP